jgi:hypothetical protein
MKRTEQLMLNVIRQLDEAAVDDFAMGELGAEGDTAEGDITEPDPEQAPPEEEPAPLTSKGEEYLLKLAYLALLYTPKEEEMMSIKNTFEASGIHDETAIKAEDPESVANTKNLIVNILGANDTTQIANDLNEIEGPQ